MIYMIALLVVALIVVMVKVVPMLFGAAAQSQLAHVVPGSVSGLPPTLAVAVRKGRGKRRGRTNESDFWLSFATGASCEPLSDWQKPFNGPSSYSYMNNSIGNILRDD